MKQHPYEKFTYYIYSDVYEEIVTHCMEAKPYEACGFLSGKQGFGEQVWRMTNEALTTHSFEVSEQDYQKLEKNVQKRHEQITAIYHSHPNSIPYPSPTDILHAPEYPIAYLIVSLQSETPMLRCFLIMNKVVYELAHQVVKRG